MDKIARIIAEKVRPALQAHGGDIELLEVTPKGIVKVRLQGACAGCLGAQQTMTHLVETVIREECPEISSVQAEQSVSEDLINEALKILRKKE